MKGISKMKKILAVLVAALLMNLISQDVLAEETKPINNEKENILTVITADMVAYGLNYETWNINEEYRDSIYNRRVRDKAEEMNINLIQDAEDKNYSDYYIFETNGIGTVSFGMEDYEKWYTENDSIDIINTEDLKVMTTLINEVILEVQKISVDQSN